MIAKQFLLAVIIDDGVDFISNDLRKLFLEISNHHSMSIVFTCQNLFLSNTEFRNMSLNAHVRSFY